MDSFLSVFSLCASSLHLSDGFRGVCRQDEGSPMVSDHYVILDSHPETPKSLWTRAVVLADVQSWVMGAREQSLELLFQKLFFFFLQWSSNVKKFDQYTKVQQSLQCTQDTCLRFISIITLILEAGCCMNALNLRSVRLYINTSVCTSNTLTTCCNVHSDD